MRFEVALGALNPDLTVLAPVRDNEWQRDDQLAYLAQRGLTAPPGGGAYSINRGLWGVTIGGQETLGSRECIPEDAWVVTRGAFDTPSAPSRHVIQFTAGVPVGFDGQSLDPVSLIEAVEAIAGPKGIGRGVHVGDTILGTKGRVAFEAPAAELILTAHRELEKLTLSACQLRIKEQMAAVYGDMVHEGQHLDPVCRDIEALLESSQSRVSGEVYLLLRPGQVFVEGTDSPHSLLAASRGTYGEAAGEWTSQDAVGFSRMRSLPRHPARQSRLRNLRSNHELVSCVRIVIMKPLVVDKVASVAASCELSRVVRISPDIPCEEGVVVAVEVLNNKSSYNKLELSSGRMAQVKAGDIVVGALGHRHALFGYSGHLPDSLMPGQNVNLLNLGGVIGICDSVNPDQGPPFECRVLGSVLHFPILGERIGRPSRVGKSPLADQPSLNTRAIPVVALAGTCMDSGKTAAACALISRFTHQGLTVAAFKATGVALNRDVLAMEDAGATETGIFTDFGIVTTTSKNGPALTRSLLTRLAEGRPDVIVFELGDGLLGAYGVEAILSDDEVRAALTAVVLCAK